MKIKTLLASFLFAALGAQADGPVIQSGDYTKLKTARGILTSTGQTLESDGEVNLLKNGGFELGTTHWTASGGVFDVTTLSASLMEGAKTGRWNASASGQTLTAETITVGDAYDVVYFYAQCMGLVASNDYVLEVLVNDVSTETATFGEVDPDVSWATTAPFVSPSSGGTIKLRIRSVNTTPLIRLDRCGVYPMRPATYLSLVTSGTINGGTLSGSNSGDVTLAAIGGTANANGASLSGQVLNLQPASASFGGVVTTGAQTIAGAKTLTGAFTASSTSDLTGRVGVGTTNSTGAGLYVGTTSGAYSGTTQTGINVSNTFSSAATTAGYGIFSQPTTQATAHTMTTAASFFAGSPIAGAGSTITTAYGLYVDNITGGSSNFSILTGSAQSQFGGKVGVKMAPSNDLDVTGTFGVTSSSNLSGRVGVGTSASSGAGLYVGTASALYSGTTQTGINVSNTFSSAATTAGYGVFSQPTTQAAAHTMTTAASFFAASPIAGAGSTITTAYGLYVDNITGGSSNFSILTGTAQSQFGGKVGVKMAPSNDLDVTGTFGVTSTSNLSGRVGVGTSASSGAGLYVGTASALYSGTTQTGINVSNTFSSAATTAGYGVFSQPTTQAAAHTMTTAASFFAGSPVAGAGSTITTAYGLYVDNITGGSSNFSILTGTAQSQFGGKVGVKMAPSNDLDVTGTFGVTGAATLAGVTTVSNSTASTTSSNGALVVTGGAGIGGQVTSGDTVKVTGSGGFVHAPSSTAIALSQYTNNSTTLHVGKDNSSGSHLTGTAYEAFVWNVDNTALKMATNNTLRFTISADGFGAFAQKFGIIAQPGASDQFAINGTSTLAGTTQRAVTAAFTATSAATAAVTGFRSNLTTAAATTVTAVVNFQANTLTVGGSGGAVTRFTDFQALGHTGNPATNNAALADNTTFTGNWFIHQDNTNPSNFDGNVTLTAQFIIATSATPAATDACTAGRIVWGADYIYVCTASGAWKRAALTGGY